MAGPGSTDPMNPTTMSSHDLSINTGYEFTGANMLYYQWTAPADGKIRFDAFRSTLLDGTSGAIDGNDPYPYVGLTGGTGGTPKDEWSGQPYNQIFGPAEGGLNQGDVVAEVTAGTTLFLETAALPHVNPETFEFTFGPVNHVLRSSDFAPNIISAWTEATAQPTIAPEAGDRWVTPDYTNPPNMFTSGTFQTFGDIEKSGPVDSDTLNLMSVCAWSIGRRALNIGEPGTGTGSYGNPWSGTCPTPTPFKLRSGSGVPSRMVGFSIHNSTRLSGLIKSCSVWANVAYCLVNVSAMEAFGEASRNDIFEIPSGDFTVEYQPVVMEALGWRPDEDLDQDESYDHSTQVAWHLKVTSIRSGSEWGALPLSTGTVEFWGNSTGAGELGDPLYLGQGGETGFIDVEGPTLDNALAFEEDNPGVEGLLFHGLVTTIKNEDYPLMAGTPPEPDPPAPDSPAYSRGRDGAIVVFRPTYTLTYRTHTVQARPELWEDEIIPPEIDGILGDSRRRFW